MKKDNKYLILIHIAILLFGSASLFGKMINQPAFAIVEGRVIISLIVMSFIFKFKNISLKLNSKSEYKKVLLLGAILAIHWVLFYHSVQMSTVAIGLLTFSTCPIFATFIEPLFFKNEKLTKENIIVALVAFFGVFLVVPKIEIGSSMLIGAIEGVLAGLTFALISVLERKYVKQINGFVISFYEQAVVLVALLPICFFAKLNPPTVSDILLILLFGTVFTVLSRYCYINGLKGVSAQTAGVLTSLEPIYGIILAALILDEIPTSRELIGGVVILAAVVYSSLKSMKRNK